jgi:hypothetical protein
VKKVGGTKMHLLFCYEYEKLNKVVYDDLRDFCLCERVNEEYVRSLIKKTNHFGIRNINIAIGFGIAYIKRVMASIKSA